MRVRAETATIPAEFATEMVEIILCQTAFEEGACVNAGCGMALEVNVVAGRAVVFAVKEVIEREAL